MSDTFSAPFSAPNGFVAHESEPTNVELDPRLRIAEIKMLGLPATYETAMDEPGYVPPVAAELACRLEVLEEMLLTKK